MPEEPRFLDPLGDINRHGGEGHRLPHWEQDGRTYFVTFRLADALPGHLTAAWHEERESCFPSLGHLRTKRNTIVSSPVALNVGSTKATVPARCAILSARPRFRQCLFRFDGERYDQHAVVVMPNHVHALVSLRANEELPSLIGVWKGASARRVNLQRGDRDVFWQKDYFDRLIRDSKHFWNCAAYIRRNPRRARLRDGEFLLRESALVAEGLAVVEDGWR